MLDQKNIDLQYSEALIRRVLLKWWARAVGPWLLVGLAAFGAPLLFGLVQGDRSWRVGALGAVIAVLLVLAQQVHRAHLRHSLARLRLLDDGRITLDVSDESLTFRSAAGTMLVRWQNLQEVRVEADYWLLLRAPNDFSTLPTRNIEPALQAALLDRFRAAGVRIRCSRRTQLPAA